MARACEVWLADIRELLLPHRLRANRLSWPPVQGILRHGHGRWREILHDEALELKEVVLAEMGAEVQAAAKSKAEAKEGGLVRRSESPPDEENGRNGVHSLPFVDGAGKQDVGRKRGGGYAGSGDLPRQRFSTVLYCEVWWR